LIGALIILIGSVFLFLAAIGLLRMPDFYTRIQAGTKASTLGTILTFIGLAFLVPNWIGKLLVLILFILITNPISSHVLARAAHFIGVPLANISATDKLKEAENNDLLNNPVENTEANDNQ
jgi:multicomponent Na+:H+ antiporter subunit G